ncbi:hypothetical protein CHS0354_025039 [Potamilus streckersoni]|uniref:Uncharacterized protein n=1 Tax=Potamilus streckersoni TaxID=2493646 RepID=A0AAE0T8Y5_9BIVA|nr:hypothetical protein CHS0354_025039 [Potamilus streckersoni]
MRMSATLNCVAELVIKHFKESTRGNGLTERRANIISTWNDRVFDTGAFKKDIAELEKKLQIPIIVKMFPDRVFYNSGCYQSNGRKPVEILDHNFHGWGVNDGNFPSTKTIRYYTGDMFKWIKSNMLNTPVNVWLFKSGGNDYDQFVMRNDSVKDNCDSGIIYRTEELQNEMIEFAKRYVDESAAEKLTRLQKIIDDNNTIEQGLNEILSNPQPSTPKHWPYGEKSVEQILSENLLKPEDAVKSKQPINTVKVSKKKTVEQITSAKASQRH